MNERILIERKHVRYLIWSTRRFPEYNVLRLGMDFDRKFGNRRSLTIAALRH